MKKIFRKAMTVLGSAALIGMTVGAAAAASYPSPFTTSTAIVVGANAAPSDNIAAASIASNLDAASAGAVSSGGVTIDGEKIALDSGSSKIWLNTSLNTAKTTLTKSDLPTVLEQTTFSGNVDSKLTSTISVGSNEVTFAKQPSTNTDPVIAITTSTSHSDPLYNLSVTMPAIAFNHTDSEGENIHLFGRDFVISTATDATSIVLFSSSEEVTLTAGGTSPSPTASVVIDGTSYEIELVTGDSSEATIAVNGESKSINEGASKKINGIDVAVKSTTESTALATLTTTVLVGSEKITFTDDSQVLKGSDDDPVDGTYVKFTGTTGALTGLNIAVYAADNNNDAILPGESMEDPVFGGFSFVFTGLNSPLDDSSREAIVIDTAGDKGMSLTMTDNNGYEKTFDFAYNASTTFLGDSNGYRIVNQEGATINVNNYTMIGNEDYGHLVQLTRVYNFTGTDYSKDAVTFKDVITGESYNMDATGEGAGRLTIDGRQYTVVYSGTGNSGTATLTYPTSDSSATQFVVFPTIKTEAGALVSLYEPQTVTLTPTMTGLKFPDGDGYTTGVIAMVDGLGNYTLDGTALNGSTGVNITVGQLKYNFAESSDTLTLNTTVVKVYQTDTGTLISAPAVIIFEGKDDSSLYETIIIDLEANAAGTSSDPVGVNDVYFSSPSLWDSVSLQSDSDISQSVDWWGTLVTEDSNTASQKTVSISYPKEQVLANVYIAESSAVVSATTSAGVMTVMDDAVSSVAGKNLVVVGGSAINSVAAELLGAAYRGEAFTSATDVGAGEFLIQSFARSGKTALLVAGYNAADTEKAVTYLLNNNVDTTVGTKLKGTSATEATLVTA